jgi:peptide/nickel transport system substrate-binding protein
MSTDTNPGVGLDRGGAARRNTDDPEDHALDRDFTLNRRAALRLLGVGAGVMLLGACGPSAPAVVPATPGAVATPVAVAPTSVGALATPTVPIATATVQSATSTAQPQAQPKSGGILHTALPSDPVSLEAHFIYPWSAESTWLPYDRLTAFDDQLKPQPVLAESWDLASDYTQIKLNLRKNVQYHSGREFTSDDVKYNILRPRDPKVGIGAFATPSRWFTTIDTPDKYTVVLKSDSPRPIMFEFFEYFNMVDKDTVERPDAKTKAVGTGPFKFVEWASGDHMTFVKNENYWQTGRPYLDQVQVHIFRDTQTSLTNFEAGVVNHVGRPPLQDTARLQQNPNYQVMLLTHHGFEIMIGMNATFPPLDNKIVRQALNYAMDRKRMVDTAFLGYGRAQSLPWSTDSPAYDATKENFYTFDLDKAKALLAQANVTNLELDLVMTGTAEGPIVGQIYQGDLATLGVKLNVKDMPSAPWSDIVNNVKFQGMWYSPSGYTHLPGTMLTSSKTWDPTNSNTGYQSEALSNITAAISTETDPAKIKAIYWQFNDLLLEDSWIGILTPSPQPVVLSNKVHGMKPTYHSGWLYADVWLDS